MCEEDDERSLDTVASPVEEATELKYEEGYDLPDSQVKASQETIGSQEDERLQSSEDASPVTETRLNISTYSLEQVEHNCTDTHMKIKSVEHAQSCGDQISQAIQSEFSTAENQASTFENPWTDKFGNNKQTGNRKRLLSTSSAETNV